MERPFLTILSCIGAALWFGGAQAATREYYVAAEDVVWDYAPSGKNLVHCGDRPPPCALPAPWNGGHAFKKVRYIEYTDGSFKTRKPQPPWLGVLGPILRAEVGDKVIVHFCNRSRHGAYSMHPHGLRYTKDHEGAHYAGANTTAKPGQGSRVAPGACFTYEWEADADSGPGAGELSSKVWWYHSHIHEPAETNAGLLGPIVVTRQGMARNDGSPKDVQREFIAAFFVFDERNGDEAGLMHAINGYVFGNLRGFIAKQGETVRWHLLGMGNEIDLHTAHWHGKTVRLGAGGSLRRTDVVELLPASMVSADMNADNPGEWLFHCHVADHLDAGMFTTYVIEAAGKTP